ncbi:hypothetical protein HOF46_02715 [Candidatus Woesearchaeota archaeon]|jgi:hypothetical protein|nr:hypothetical protein [Candidatus Woesearchaeota archaeon]MBT4114218.1 hypothetical protein [Candidatus Woesearchaeota archaeon]
MLNKTVLAVVMLLVIPTAVTAITTPCGDGICFNDAPNFREDLSTCYADCHDADFHEITLRNGNSHMAILHGTQYRIEKYDVLSCGANSRIDLHIVSPAISGGEFRDSIRGGSWSYIGGNSYVNFRSTSCTYAYPDGYHFDMSVPCDSCDGANAILKIRDRNYELEELNQYEFLHTDEKILAVKAETIPDLHEPRCTYELIDSRGFMAYDFDVCDFQEVDISGLSPGEYELLLNVYNIDREHVLGTESMDLILHGCDVEPDCNDGRFLTSDSCEWTENVRLCKNNHWLSFLGFE